MYKKFFEKVSNNPGVRKSAATASFAGLFFAAINGEAQRIKEEEALYAKKYPGHKPRRIPIECGVTIVDTTPPPGYKQ